MARSKRKQVTAEVGQGRASVPASGADSLAVQSEVTTSAADGTAEASSVSGRPGGRAVATAAQVGDAVGQRSTSCQQSEEGVAASITKRLQDSANRAGSVFLLKPQLAFVGQQPMGPSIVLNEAVTGPAPGELTPEFRELELRLARSFGFAEEPSAPIAQGQRLESLYPDSNFRYAKELLAFERRQRGFGNAPMSSWSTARVR